MAVDFYYIRDVCAIFFFFFSTRHAEVMKKIIETVAEGGGELGVHMYPFFAFWVELLYINMGEKTSFKMAASFFKMIACHCTSSDNLLPVLLQTVQ